MTDQIVQIAELNHRLYRLNNAQHAQYERLRTRRYNLLATLRSDKLKSERDAFRAISRSGGYEQHVRRVALDGANDAATILRNRGRANDVILRRTDPSLRIQPRRPRQNQLNDARDRGALDTLQRNVTVAEARTYDLPFFERETFIPSSLHRQLPINRANAARFMRGVEEVYVDITDTRHGWFFLFVKRNIARWYDESFTQRDLPGAVGRRLPRWGIFFTERRESIYFHYEAVATLGAADGFSFEQHAYVAFTVCAFWEQYVTIHVPSQIIEDGDGRRIQFPAPSSIECGGKMFDLDGDPFYITRATSANIQRSRIEDLAQKLDGLAEDAANSLLEFQGSDKSNPDTREAATSVLTKWHELFAHDRDEEDDRLEWTIDAELIMFFRPSAFNNFNNPLLEILQVLNPLYRDLIEAHLNAEQLYDATIDEV